MSETASNNELENKNIRVTMEEKPGCKVKLDIHVSSEESAKAYDKALREINKLVSIPGFRKGKAPSNLITQRYASYIEKEWREKVVNFAFREAMELTKAYPFKEDGIKPTLKTITQDKGSSLTLEFERYPNIPDIDPSKLSLEPVTRDPITQDEINETLENIRLHHAKWTDITDRPAQEEDYVIIDIEILGDKPFKIAEGAQFHLKEGKMGDWMRKLLIGAKIGDAVEGMSEKGPEVKEEDFKPSETRITLHKIKTAILPDLDDDLAKKVGAPDSEELKVRVEKDLNRQANDEVQQQLRDQLRDKLVEKYPFDIPFSLVEEEKRAHLTRRLQSLKDQKLPDEEYRTKAALLESNIINDITNAFRLYFIAGNIFRKEHFSISSEELMQELLRESYLNPHLREVMEKNPEMVRERSYTKLMIQKVQDHLIDAIGTKKPN